MDRLRGGGGRRVPEVLRQVAAVEVRRQTIEVDDPCARSGGETLPRRTARLSGELLSLLFPHSTTLPHAFKGATESNRNRAAVSARVWTGDKWGAYECTTYGALSARVDNFGSGLRNLGLRSGDFLAIWADNSVEWVVASLAAFAHSLVVVPIRPDVSPTTARHILTHSNAKVVICSHATLPDLASVIKKCKKVSHAVAIPRSQKSKGSSKGGVELEDMRDLGKCQLRSFAEVETNGSQKPIKPIIPDASSPAVIAYTEGSNGAPKGVEISHAALVATQAGLVPMLEAGGEWVVDSDVFYAHNTFASTFHFTLLFTLLACGATIGMPSEGDENLAADVEKLRPTIFAGTPEVYQRIYTRLMQLVAQSSTLKKWMFKKGWSAKRGRRRGGTEGGGGVSVWDGLVFNNFKASMGGRVRLFLSSDYPLPPNTRHFLQICFNCAVVEVYTLTEAVGIVSATNPSDPASLHVGSPIASLEVKLIDAKALGFVTSHKPPSGEICIRGMSVAQRYLDDDALTDAVFDEDGWVHTGDIGTWNENGTLTLVDRKENIVKLQGGDFVALGKMEGLYARSQFVQQIYVHGDDTEPCLVAIVLVHPSVVRSFASKPAVRHQFEGQSEVSELIENPIMRNVVVADLRAIGKSLGVRSCELVRAVHLEIGEWTVGEGLVTPNKRLHRNALHSKYRDEIAELYAELKRKAREAVEGEDDMPSSPSSSMSSPSRAAASQVQFSDTSRSAPSSASSAASSSSACASVSSADSDSDSDSDDSSS